MICVYSEVCHNLFKNIRFMKCFKHLFYTTFLQLLDNMESKMKGTCVEVRCNSTLISINVLSIDKKVYRSVIYGYSPFNCWSEQDVQKDVQTKISSTNLCSVFVGYNSKIVRRKNAGMYSSVMVNKVVFFLSCKILYLYFKILQLHLTLKYLKTNELWFIAR